MHKEQGLSGQIEITKESDSDSSFSSEPSDPFFIMTRFLKSQVFELTKKSIVIQKDTILELK